MTEKKLHTGHCRSRKKIRVQIKILAFFHIQPVPKFLTGTNRVKSPLLARYALEFFCGAQGLLLDIQRQI